MSKGVKISGVTLPIEELHFNFITHKLRTEYGFIESSSKNMPLDNKNNIMPMFTYPCFEYLNSIDWLGADVFEYGAGYSTLYWNKKGVNYHGVENNSEWFEKIKGNNKNIFLKEEPKDFVNSISSCDKQFDVIVLDSVYRYDCVKPALDCVKDEGMIILDNSDWHKNTKELLDKSDLIPVHFHGFKPLHVDSETTSCYIGRDFKRKAKSILPMAGTIREQNITDTKQL